MTPLAMPSAASTKLLLPLSQAPTASWKAPVILFPTLSRIVLPVAVIDRDIRRPVLRTSTPVPFAVSWSSR